MGGLCHDLWHVDCVRNIGLTAFAERYASGVNGMATTSARAKPLRSTPDTQGLIAMLPRDALTKTMVRQAIDALNYLCLMERLQAEMQALAAQLRNIRRRRRPCGVGDSLGLSSWRSSGM